MDAGAGRPQTAQVLIVDDEALMRAILRDILEESGYGVLEAGSGPEALQLVRQARPDAVLLDIVMPGMDGFATCAALRRLPEGEHLPVLMITALEDAAMIDRAYAVGATDYLPKPVNGLLLRHHLRYMLRATRLFDELRQKEERLAVAQRSARLGYWDWDPQAGELECSQEACNILGLTAPPLASDLTALFERAHPEDRQAILDALNATLSGRGACEIDYRVRLPEGDLRHLSTQAELIVDRSRKGWLLAGTVQDLTERKLAEEKLLLAGKVFDHSSEMILITDPDFTIIDVNPAFSQVTGYARQAVVGSNFRSFQSNQHDEHFFRALQDSLDQFGHWRGELWSRHQDGEAAPALLAISAVKNPAAMVTHYVIIATDISRLRETERRLQYLAQFDPLTDLPNRTLFHDRLEQALIHAVRNDGVVCVLCCDLDNFKEINDTLGHQAGDNVLQLVGQRLARRLRKSDTVARLGSDEFAVILREINRNESGALVAQRVLEELGKPFTVSGKEFYLTGSVGLALYPDDAEAAEDLAKKAETAMHFAKQQGKNCYQFFSAEMNSLAQERLLLKSELRRAIERQELLLHYQAKFDSHSGALTGVEALVRWRHPQRGLIPPMQFIPLAEETGLIVPLGELVLDQACRQNLRWRQQGYVPFRVAVNLSARQFSEGTLVDTVSRVLAETGLPADGLELEITESAFMHNTARAAEILYQFKAMGIRIALDDFGTGYSSLSYLKRFPIDVLKIDYSFVKNIFVNAEDAAIVKATIAMAHSLHLKTIAEGVETEETRVFLREQGCDEVQGYLAGMPLPAAEIEAFLPRLP